MIAQRICTCPDSHSRLVNSFGRPVNHYLSSLLYLLSELNRYSCMKRRVTCNAGLADSASRGLSMDCESFVQAISLCLAA